VSDSKAISTLKENKKVIFFLIRFLSVFGTLSLVYGAWVKSFNERADAISWLIGYNLKFLFGSSNLQLSQSATNPSVDINYLGTTSVTLFEGCNGIAVMILFIAFIFAFKGRWLDLVWFAPLGIFVIHAFNLARLSALIILAQQHSEFFHFVHKYLFTLIIYSGVFLLWVFWVKLAVKRNQQNAQTSA